MALDKLVDSTQLNTDLTSVANAIRTKGGTSSQLAFPSGFVSAIQNIPSGGGGSIVITDEANATGTTAVVTAHVMDLITKSITQNGTYSAASDSADGYSSVTVNVSGGGTPSATQHSIYFEFSDQTNTTFNVYYDDPMISTMITAYTPATYGVKTVTLAQLDGVTWYEPANIPIGVELIDYTETTQGYYVGDDGDLHENEWSIVSDYTVVDPIMTFSYTAYYWYYIGVYDASKNLLRTIYCMNDATVDPNDGNTGHGTLSGNKLSNAAYVRLCGTEANSNKLSLIRTA